MLIKRKAVWNGASAEIAKPDPKPATVFFHFHYSINIICMAVLSDNSITNKSDIRKILIHRTRNLNLYILIQANHTLLTGNVS